MDRGNCRHDDSRRFGPCAESIPIACPAQPQGGIRAGPATSPPPAALGESSAWRVPNPPPSGDMGLVPPQAPPLQSQSIMAPQQQISMPGNDRFLESSWYTRADYFHWNERVDGADFVNEYGDLITLGYCRTIGCERFRGEVFGGTMHYVGGVQYDDGSSEPFFSNTEYVGLLGEYDLLFEPNWWPETTMFLGVGSRFWMREFCAPAAPLGQPR